MSNKTLDLKIDRVAERAREMSERASASVRRNAMRLARHVRTANPSIGKKQGA